MLKRLGHPHHFFLLFEENFIEFIEGPQGVDAGISLEAVGAVGGRLTDGVLGRKDLAVALVTYRAHGVGRLENGRARGDLGCDLKAVEQESGAARIELGGAERTEDLGERNLDGA